MEPRQCAHCEGILHDSTTITWRDLWFCSPGCHQEWVEQAEDPYRPEE